MKKNETRFLVLFSMFSVLVFAGALSLRDRISSTPHQAAAGAIGITPHASDIGIDADANFPAASDDQVVVNKASNYSFSTPANWYVEKNTAAGFAVYPDYDPTNGVAPECKIEISSLDYASASVKGELQLNAWITGYLHADPTVTVAEISRTPVRVASSSAIEWYGGLNGATTTLVYVVVPASNKTATSTILELAPSTLSSASDADNDDCNFALQALMANLNFGNHAQ